MTETLHPKSIQSKEQAEQIKNAPCAWPQCGKKMHMTVSIPLLVNTPTGPVPHPNKKVAIPYCLYHSLVVQSSGMFAGDMVKGGIAPRGPHEFVVLIESVIAAKAAAARIEARNERIKQTNSPAGGDQENNSDVGVPPEGGPG